MRVILTHEQADMDALASQLGAWILYPDAYPILPHKINRNGVSLIAEFGEQLPYIDYKAMPHEPIDEVILVDTQSLITLKGMHQGTKVVVYDHHPLKDDIDPEWDLNLVTSGSNVSQMIERIKQQGIEITPLQATILALGLYEDTGSFSYGSVSYTHLRAHET